jgi:hypothetical protein
MIGKDFEIATLNMGQIRIQKTIKNIPCYMYIFESWLLTLKNITVFFCDFPFLRFVVAAKA